MKRGWKLGQLGGKKSHRNKRDISRCKKQGKGRRRKMISRDLRSAEKSFCRHLKQEKFICYSLVRENSQGRAQREVSDAFEELGCLGKRGRAVGWGWNRENQGGVPEICDSQVLCTHHHSALSEFQAGLSCSVPSPKAPGEGERSFWILFLESGEDQETLGRWISMG